MTEPARTFPRSIVTAHCIDCELEFTGPLGVRFIDTPEGPGLEVVVVVEQRNEIHAIARVQIGLVPIVRVDAVPLSPTGSA